MGQWTERFLKSILKRCAKPLVGRPERNRRKVCAKRLRSLSWEKRFLRACEEHATRGSFDICRYYDSSRHFVLKIASRTRQFVAARWHTDCSSFKQRGRHVACFYVSDSKNVRGRDQTPRQDAFPQIFGSSYCEIHQIFYFPVAPCDFWMLLGITEQ